MDSPACLAPHCRGRTGFRCTRLPPAPSWGCVRRGRGRTRQSCSRTVRPRWRMGRMCPYMRIAQCGLKIFLDFFLSHDYLYKTLRLFDEVQTFSLLLSYRLHPSTLPLCKGRLLHREKEYQERGREVAAITGFKPYKTTEKSVGLSQSVPATSLIEGIFEDSSKISVLLLCFAYSMTKPLTLSLWSFTCKRRAGRPGPPCTSPSRRGRPCRRQSAPRWGWWTRGSGSASRPHRSGCSLSRGSSQSP